MQPIPSVVGPPQPMMGLGNRAGQPETGEFDFMSYLLGLQGSPVASPTDSLTPQPQVAPKKGDAQDPLQALFAAFPMSAMNPSLPAELRPPSEQTLTEAVLSGEQGDLPGRLSPALSSAGGTPEPGVMKAEDRSAAEISVSRKAQAEALKKYEAHQPPSEELAAHSGESRPSGEPLSEAVAGKIPVPQLKKEASPVKHASEADGGTFDVSHLAPPTLKASVAEVAETRGSEAKGPVAVPEVMQRVETLVHRGGGEMTVTLDPPELGRVEIKVTARGNRVEVEMRSESHQAKSALESHFSDLKSAMQSQDLHLAKMEVQVHRDAAAAFGHSFAGMPDGRQAGNAQGGFNQQQERPFPESDRRLSAPVNVPQVTARTASPIGGDGRVDLRI